MKIFVTIGLLVLAKPATKGCLICFKVGNKAKQMIKKEAKWWSPGPVCQVDLTAMCRAGQLKYLLVILCQLTGWLEVFRVASAASCSVTKIFLGQIIPRYGMIEAIDADRETDFTGKVLQGIMTHWRYNRTCIPPGDPKVQGRWKK